MVSSITLQEASRVAFIHQRALAGDFLPSLGNKFLTSFYQGIIGKPGIYSFAYYEDGELVGYIIGAEDINRLIKLALKSKLFQLIFYLFVQVIRKPILIKSVIETFFYPQKDSGPKSELVVIAVLDHFQGRGIGRMLVNRLEKAFKARGVEKYKVSVHSDKKAVSFYEHLGFKRSGFFNLYAKMWYLYERKL